MVAIRLVGLALALTAAHAAFLTPFLNPTVRDFHPGLSVDQWKKDEGESSKQCPEIVSIGAYRRTKSSSVYLVQHRDMAHDFVECSGKDDMAMIDFAALQNITKLKDAESDVQRAARLTLIKDGEFMGRASGLVGAAGRVFALVELGPRTCGVTQFDEGTLGFFIGAKKGAIEPIELDLFKKKLDPKRKHMVMYEGGVGGRKCLYSMKVGKKPYPRPTNDGNVTIPIETEEPEPTPTPEATPTPARENQGSGNVFGGIADTGNGTAKKRACFPASALAESRTGPIAMADLRVGDEVHVGGGKFSRVFMFTHQEAEGSFPFVQLTSSAGTSLTASGGHLAYIAGRLRPVADARIGDEIVLADGALTRVVKRETVTMQGLYNPQTEAGDIVVDGVLASCYTTAVPAKAAHSLLTPLRALAAVCLSA